MPQIDLDPHDYHVKGTKPAKQPFLGSNGEGFFPAMLYYLVGGFFLSNFFSWLLFGEVHYLAEYFLRSMGLF